jgi:hypothetical protein
MAAGTAADKRTIVQRLIDIAKNVGVLEPEKSGGVPFAFRGVDAVVAKLTPLLNENGVIVVPQESRQILSQRDVGAKVVTKADVEVTYRFYGAEGDFLDVQVVGQADDFADRSSAQAMSVAFRIALLQTFHIAAFGNEEAASEATKNEREAGGGSGSGNSKIDKAKEASAKPKVDPAAQMRDAILAAAAQKGWEPDRINEFATDVTGVDVDAWFNDPDKLNLILSKINEAK